MLKETRTVNGIGPGEKGERIVAGEVTTGGGFGSEMEKARMRSRRRRR